MWHGAQVIVEGRKEQSDGGEKNEPREVMTSVIHDFNNIAGELARRPASLFDFLKSVLSANKQADELGLTLYAEPKYWLYGLLSFCAKACEAKIEEANGRPAQKAKEEGACGHRQNISTNANSSNVLRRNQRLGTPDLPIHHLHVYFTLAQRKDTGWWRLGLWAVVGCCFLLLGCLCPFLHRLTVFPFLQ